MFSTYGRTINAATAQVWYEATDDIPPDALKYGMDEATKTCKEFPTPAHVRALAAEQASEALQLDAERALAHLDQRAAKYGADLMPCYGEKRPPALPASINHAMNAVYGGWRGFATADYSQRHDPAEARRKARQAFKDEYVAFRLRAAKHRTALMLEENPENEFREQLQHTAQARLIQ